MTTVMFESVIVNHAQSAGIIRVFLTGRKGLAKIFKPGGQKTLLGCGTQADTIIKVLAMVGYTNNN